MTNDLTLHCFPGDINSLAILLVAEHLGVDLKVRYLKPVNVAEKFYKVSLTKKFPMLEVKTKDGYYLIERSNCIVRFLTEEAKGSDISDRSKFSYAVANQNTEVIGQYVLPALVTLRAMRMGIIEEDKELDLQLLGELKEQLGKLDAIVAQQKDVELNHSDFLLFAVLRAARDVGCLNPTLRSMESCKARYQKLAENKKVGTLLAPYDPSRLN